MAGKFNKQELNNKGNQVKLRGFFYQNLYQSWLEQWEYNINRAGIKDTDICPLCNFECHAVFNPHVVQLHVSVLDFLESV